MCDCVLFVWPICEYIVASPCRVGIIYFVRQNIIPNQRHCTLLNWHNNYFQKHTFDYTNPLARKMIRTQIRCHIFGLYNTSHKRQCGPVRKNRTTGWGKTIGGVCEFTISTYSTCQRSNGRVLKHHLAEQRYLLAQSISYLNSVLLIRLCICFLRICFFAN